MLQLASAISLPGPSGNCWPRADSPEQPSIAAASIARDLLDIETSLEFALSVFEARLYIDG
jgi:hypothetical protein